MALTALPAELTINIAEILDPHSTLKFALTCKSHSALCKSVLEKHARLFNEWQIIDTTDAELLLWQTLKEVLDDPRKGWYVRELNLPPNRQYNWTSRMSLFPPHPCADLAPSGEEKDMFKAAARKLEKLYPILESQHLLAREANPSILGRPNDLVGTIEDRIDAGKEDGVVTILLHYLPYLKTIRLTEVDDTSDCLELMMHRVAGGYKDPAVASKLPLQHLTTAAVSHCNTEGSITANWACSFLGIPSLKTFGAYRMGNSPSRGAEDYYLLPGKMPCSNVTELFFACCLFNVEGLSVILAGLKNLKKFTYWGGDEGVSWASYKPKETIQALAKHVGHTVEEIVLDREDIDDDDHMNEDALKTVSLQEFQKLKILNCPWDMVRPEDEESDNGEPLEQGFHRKEDNIALDTDFDIRSILPESLQELYLHGTFFDTDGHYEWQAMERVFHHPNPMTPNLSLEKTCIRQVWNGGEIRERIGTADAPLSVDDHPLMHELFDGHGYSAL
ncbi:hypothetical protein CC86DRAFT_364086 [Ophiobolus disseminans]|uniref:F-box domain-containing protein n=1 Tax=Ophiobolus disseminans TaxID=1469910 RepID=A0A6A6ZDX8_9PLEO|nr:hypothetical protein CC86DRAFT_364086 [Ophiobolus disseminans]